MSNDVTTSILSVNGERALPKIGKLEPVPIRELWKHEERDFSAWLQENLDVLSDAIGIQLSEPERELSAGDFQCDLVAEDDGGNRVIIENQLEPTNHDHLGKILTYLTNLEARTAIWIATTPRPEHVRTIQWLNETTPEDIAFYLVRLAAYRIEGYGPAAPLFTVIVRPSGESKGVGRQKKELAGRHVLRLKFWEQLLARAKQKGVLLHAQRAPCKNQWIAAGAGVQAGIIFVYLIWMDEAAVELYIDVEDKDENKRIFDALFEKKTQIEQAFGERLSWERLDDKRASRIRFVVKEGGLLDEANWPAIQDAMVSAMDKLSKAVKPYLTRP